MDKKGQVLIIVLSILITLAVLAVNLGQNVSLSLKLAGSHTHKLGSYALAKAGVSLAIKEIDRYNKQLYSALNETWANNEQLFKNITFDEDKNQYATVSYQRSDDTSGQETIYGAVDEESKINLNTASQELLVSLFKECKISSAEQLATNICAWRGDQSITLPDYGDLGYTNKGKVIYSVEELILVKDITPEIYGQIRDFLTVYGSGKININTVSPELLRVLFSSVSSDSALTEKMASTITQFRFGADMQEGTPDDNQFQDPGALADIFTDADASTVINQILTKNLITVKSDYFRIMATGFARNITTGITVIYDSKNNKIVYWHEN